MKRTKHVILILICLQDILSPHQTMSSFSHIIPSGILWWRFFITYSPSPTPPKPSKKVCFKQEVTEVIPYRYEQEESNIPTRSTKARTLRDQEKKRISRTKRQLPQTDDPAILVAELQVRKKIDREWTIIDH